jgi:protein-tyrosine phosphatase
MLPLIDVHCHLLAGLDDGPRTWDDARAMCRLAVGEGTQLVAATAHQNERWPGVTPALIREATGRLVGLLACEGIPLEVVPSAEVMARIDLEEDWDRGGLLGVAGGGQYLLLEMPHRVFVDLLGLVGQLGGRGVRVILAHPERHPEWLHEPGAIEEMIAAGCLVQVSSGSVTGPASAADSRALRDWFRRGVVHLAGSDGHSPRGGRAPRMRAAYEQVCRWAGTAAADRVFSTNGLAVLRGLPLRVAPPAPYRWWKAFIGRMK